MCGIAGYLSKTPDRNGMLQPLADLQRALRHRGPDDEGLWTDSTGMAGFVHTRLSILDLSAAGHQPMSTADGRLTITFNGEIYNFRELRAGLEAAGVSFRTSTDTEVILRLYEKHGEGVVNLLVGMFAFAIWDARSQSCFIARDPLGIKPLYYCKKDGKFCFASELKALQAAGLAGKRLCLEAVTGYFETGSVPEPLTLLEDARCLEAGHCLTWRDGIVEKRAYWEIRFDPDPIAPRDAVDTLREALLATVRRHFVSDVPVGIFLSGGVDSTSLVALARATGVSDLSTFSIGVDDSALDESSIARRTAAHFRTRHLEMQLDESTGRKLFEHFIRHIDQPSIDGYNTYTVSTFAREHGMKVVLSGLGSDELFAGYRTFADVPRLAALSKRLDGCQGLRSQAGRLMERLPSSRLRRVGTFFQKPPSIQSACRAYRGIFCNRDARILAARYAGMSEPVSSPLRDANAPPPPLLTPGDEVSRCELSLYMRNQLLKDSDVMSMARGLELRVPFVDRSFFESVASIPASIRLQAGKKILLSAVPEIPDFVAGQPKRGFLFPYQKWATSTWGSLFEHSSRQLPVPRPSWYQQWCVFMLNQWMDQHGLSRAES